MPEIIDPFEAENKVRVLGDKLRELQQDLDDWLNAYNDASPMVDSIIRIYEKQFGDWSPDE